MNKFRVWDDFHQPQHPPQYWYSEEIGLGKFWQWVEQHPGKAEKNIQRGMGEQDKKGIEIYEGDIVEVETDWKGNKAIYIVRYGKCQRKMDSGHYVGIIGFYFELYKPGDYYHKFPYFSIICNFMGCHDLEITEVIGNIHENKNLLTDEI